MDEWWSALRVQAIRLKSGDLLPDTWVDMRDEDERPWTRATIQRKMSERSLRTAIEGDEEDERAKEREEAAKAESKKKREAERQRAAEAERRKNRDAQWKASNKLDMSKIEELERKLKATHVELSGIHSSIHANNLNNQQNSKKSKIFHRNSRNRESKRLREELTTLRRLEKDLCTENGKNDSALRQARSKYDKALKEQKQISDREPADTRNLLTGIVSVASNIASGIYGLLSPS